MPGSPRVVPPKDDTGTRWMEAVISRTPMSFSGIMSCTNTFPSNQNKGPAFKSTCRVVSVAGRRAVSEAEANRRVKEALGLPRGSHGAKSRLRSAFEETAEHQKYDRIKAPISVRHASLRKPVGFESNVSNVV